MFEEERFQQLLARLYTEVDFRDSFFKNRKTYSKDFSEHYKANLNELKQDQVVHFAAGLVLKREEIVRSMLPELFMRYEKDLVSVFREYAPKHPLKTGAGKHIEDRDLFLKVIVSSPELPMEIITLSKMYQQENRMRDGTSSLIINYNQYDLNSFWDIGTNSPQKLSHWRIYFKLFDKVIVDKKVVNFF